MKTKIKSYDDEAINFHNKEMPNVSSNHPCLAVITINSVFKKDEKSYPPVFLRKFKYNEKKMIRHITDDLMILKRNRLKLNIKIFENIFLITAYIGFWLGVVNDWGGWWFKVISSDFKWSNDLYKS